MTNLVNRNSLWELVGNTPLIRLNKISDETGSEVWAKLEYYNPGGSIKDRAAKQIILDAEKNGQLKPGSTIYEGTAGNTGIGLALLGIQRGYKVVITMPDSQSSEKFQMLKALGAEIKAVPPVPFSNKDHFYHQAQRLAESDPKGYWANQFENLSNQKAHYLGTGPEIWSQTAGKITHFVTACGTGGTIGGVSQFLKEKSTDINVTLADPFGSGLYQFLKTGILQATGGSVTEGIGIMRLTENFKSAKIDDCLQVSDQEMIKQLFDLCKSEGLFVGTSAALNVAAAKKIAIQKKNQFIVTMICDHGSRYQSRVLSDDWLRDKINWNP